MKSYPMSRRDFLKAATLTGAGLVLAACTQATEAPTELPQEEPTKPPEEPTQPPPEPTEEPVEAPPAEEAVTVTVWGWWEDRMKFFQESGDKYTEQNPNVTVEVISVDQDLWQKVFASVPAGTGPTLCKMITTHYFQLRDEGLLIPLDEVVFPPSFLQEKFPNFAWEQYGRYVMPEGNQAAIFAYNKTMFEEAGLDPEVPPGTWDEFVDAAVKLTKADDQGTLTREGIAIDDWFPLMNPLFQLGGTIVLHDGDVLTANFDTPEMEKSIQLYLDFANVHKIYDYTFPYFTDAVGNEQAATAIGEAWSHGVWLSDFPEVYEQLGFSAPPTPSGQPEPYYGRQNAVLGLALLVNRPDSETAEGAKFQEFLYKEDLESQLNLSNISGLAPAHIDNLTRPDVLSDPFTKLGIELVAKEYDMVELSSALTDFMYATWDRMFVEGASVDEILADGQMQIQEMIDNGDIKYTY